MKSPLILVYSDVGSGEMSLLQLITALTTYFPDYRVEKTNGSLIQTGYHRLDNETALLCFGGGYDLGYLKSLGVSGSRKVREYILNGGRYLGICAGAYFGSGYCEFDAGGPLEILGHRDIKVYEGTAVGPYYPGFQYDSYAGSRAPRISATNVDLHPQSATVFYQGGCTFRGKWIENTIALYNYPKSVDPAIIVSRLGKGWGVLSGVHFEYDPDILMPDLKRKSGDQRIAQKIKDDNGNRVSLLKLLIVALITNNPDGLVHPSTSA